MAAAAAHLIGSTSVAAPAADLSGQWTTSTLTDFERPEELKGLVLSPADAAAYERKRRGRAPPIPDDTIGAAESEWWETDAPLARVRGQARSSWIVSPADGQMPFTAAARAANKARREASKTNFDNPEARPPGERCLETAGPPFGNGGYNDGFRIVQTRDAVAIHFEWMNDLRIVRLDDRRHPPPSLRFAGGASVGWWEGPTLVIETTNFAPASVKAADGDPTRDMRVVERLTRLSASELHYEFFIHNPGRFIQPILGEMVFRATDRPMFEFACHEGNYALGHVLAGGRQADGAAADGAVVSASSGSPAP